MKIPDVLLLSMDLPEIDTMNSIGLIKQEYEDLKILACMRNPRPEMTVKVIEMGAATFLSNPTQPKETYQAILSCLPNTPYFKDIRTNMMLRELLRKKT